MPVISVIIPTYNAERTILETIESVQQQTFSDFELIVIDDGSTDRTLEILQSIEDDRLKIFAYENGGEATAHNRGILHATGEFVAFLGHDDLWTPDKLESQFSALKQNPNAGVAYSWTYFMEEQEGARFLYPCKPIFYQGNVYANLLVGDFIYSYSNTLIRKQAIDSIGEIDSTVECCGDWDYWVRLSAKWQFVVVPKYQVLYRRSSGGQSSRIDAVRKSSLILIEKIFRDAPLELQHLKKQCMVGFNLYCASLYLQYGSRNTIRQGNNHLWKAICLQPSLLMRSSIYKMLVQFLLIFALPLNFAKRLFKLASRRKLVVPSVPDA